MRKAPIQIGWGLFVGFNAIDVSDKCHQHKAGSVPAPLHKFLVILGLFWVYCVAGVVVFR